MKNMKELFENIEKCDYKCIAGDLENNIDYIEIKKRFYELEETLNLLVGVTFSNK